jgi:FkbM family methyltransferase
MKVVVDLGCYGWDDKDCESIPILIDEYQPDLVYGFDVHPDLEVGAREVAGVPVQVERAAAWDGNGVICYELRGAGTKVGQGTAHVACFDFSEWLADRAGGDAQVFVKMDIEGAEYTVLRKMHRDGTDTLMAELLVEWHGQPYLDVACPVRQWWV